MAKSQKLMMEHLKEKDKKHNECQYCIFLIFLFPQKNILI